MVHQTSVVHSVIDVSLVSVVKDTEGLTVCSNRPWNKYDPEYILGSGFVYLHQKPPFLKNFFNRKIFLLSRDDPLLIITQISFLSIALFQIICAISIVV